jgi:hypothetical protein
VKFFFTSGLINCMRGEKLTSGHVNPALKFFPEKYFTIYLSERTELFSHMTARPHDPDSRRRPLCVAVALVLVAAVLLAAGCNRRDLIIRIKQ